MPKLLLLKRTEFGTLKKALFHDLARSIVSEFPDEIKKEFGHLLFFVQMGKNLGMPYARPMKSILPGCYELRVRGQDGNYRFFYFLKNEKGVLVFHAFVKKDEKTLKSDLDVGKKRLLEMLREHG